MFSGARLVNSITAVYTSLFVTVVLTILREKRTRVCVVAVVVTFLPARAKHARRSGEIAEQKKKQNAYAPSVYRWEGGRGGRAARLRPTG